MIYTYIDQNWRWIDLEDKLEFTHSIFGILAISLAIFQVCLIKSCSI